MGVVDGVEYRFTSSSQEARANKFEKHIGVKPSQIKNTIKNQKKITNKFAMCPSILLNVLLQTNQEIPERGVFRKKPLLHNNRWISPKKILLLL